jgi:para-nitrobenzyl esterase
VLRHQSREEGARLAHAFVDKLGLTSSSLSEIRNLPWLQLLAAQEDVGAHLFAPVLDGSHLVHDPFHPAAPAESVGVPLIVSTTLDDAGLFLAQFDLTEPALMNILSQQYGEPATRVLELYRGHFPMKSPYLLHAHIITDAGFRRLSHEQAEQKARQLGAPVYSYLWEWTSPAYEGKFGAAHAMDVSASFHNDRDALLGCGSREAQLMCGDLASTWIQFAKTGDPNNKSIPKWPPYDAEKRSTLNFGPNTRIVDDPYGEIRAFWLGMPGPSGVLG